MTQIQPGNTALATAKVARLGVERPAVVTPGDHVGETLGARLRKHRHFYLFISPFFLLFAVLGLYPLAFSLYLSFARWDGLGPVEWAGLDNFRLLFADANFWSSLGVTLILGVIYVPPMFALALGLALLLNDQTLRLRGLFRAAVFVPCITPMVVIAVVFALLFGTQSGLVNWLWTGLFGGEPVAWLETKWGARLAVCVVLVWRWTGYNMVLMLAGLQGIPNELYEAATLDGASRFQKFRHVTIPLLRPTLTFCAVMSLVGTAFMFDEPFVLTNNGGPGVATTNFGLYLFQLSFESFRFGYASAAAYVVAVVVFLLTLLVLRLGRSAE